MADYACKPEMAQLFRRAQAGDRRCLSRLMRRHDGLVPHVIRQQRGGALTYAETLQEGRIALWQAIFGFDPERGTAVSTYAGGHRPPGHVMLRYPLHDTCLTDPSPSPIMSCVVHPTP